MKFYHDLIMAQFRSQPASLKKYPNKAIGTFETLEANPSLLTIHALNELYWVLDDMAFCERAAMLGNIYSPNCRNIRMVKRLAEINLVRGNYAATRKYLRILQKHSSGKDGPTAFSLLSAKTPVQKRKPYCRRISTSARTSDLSSKTTTTSL